MKKIEIKKVGPLSLFKTIMYMLSIPIAFLVIIGLIVILIGIFTKTLAMAGAGFIITLGYPLIFLVFYGIFGTLMALIYNWLAGKFGGLELTIEESESEIKTVANEEQQ